MNFPVPLYPKFVPDVILQTAIPLAYSMRHG